MNQVIRNRIAFLSILRYRDYRIYYLGLLASVTAYQGMMAVNGWLAFELTGQPVTLGIVGAAQAAPGLLFNLVSGALADRFDPRRMVLFGEGAAAVLMACLAALVFTGTVTVLSIVVIAFLVGIATSFDQPARRVIWLVLIPRSEYAAGTALNQAVWNGTRVVGPAIAMGIVAAMGKVMGNDRLGSGFAFAVITFGFLSMATTITMVRMPSVKRAGGATVLHDIFDGLAFVARNRIFVVLMTLSFCVGYFGLSYQQLLPAFAKDNLGMGPAGLGWLYVTGGIGGIAGIVIAASFGDTADRAKLIGFGAVLMGISLIAFGLSGEWAMAGLALVLAGAAGALYSIFQTGSNLLLNLLVPEEYRGRVLGLRGIMWSLSPLGGLQAGYVAGAAGTPFSIAIGGAAVIVITAIVFAFSARLRNVEKLVAQMEVGDEPGAAEAPAS